MVFEPIKLLPWRTNPILPTVFSDSLTELENIGALVCKLNELIEDYNMFIGMYQEYIQSQIEPLQNQLNNLIQEVRNMLEDEDNKIDEKIAELEQNVSDQLNAQNETFEQTVQRLDDLIVQLRKEMDDLDEDIKAWVEYRVLRATTDITALVSEQLSYLETLIQLNNEQNKLWIEARLAEFMAQFPNKTMYVINPVTGVIDTLQETLYDLYNMARIDGLTAQQYDELELTAEEYDAKMLTAYEYDMYAVRTWYKDPRFYMFSPFTGEYTLVKYVVEELAALHKEGIALTAEEYDDLEITAYMYDIKEITAYDYDWKGKLLLVA